MTTDLVQTDQTDIASPDREQARAALVHYAATGGDVSQMSLDERASFILWQAEQMGISAGNGALQIMEFWDDQQKRKVAKVYAKAEALAQIGSNHRIRIETLTEGPAQGGLYKVSVRGHQPDGRTCDEVGYVSLTDREGKPLVGDRYRNALMKCHTVAKRRLIRAMTGVAAPPPDARRLYLGPRGELLEHPTEEDIRLNDHPNEAAASGRPRFETMAPPMATGLEETPDLRPHPSDLERSRRDPTEPPPSFKPSDADIQRWLGAWHATVKGTSLESDDGRHRFFEQWSDGRTASSRNWFASATERQAGELLAHVRMLADDERQAIAASQAEDSADD